MVKNELNGVVLKGTGSRSCYSLLLIQRILTGLHGFILLPTLSSHRFGIVIMVLDGIFMRFDVNENFFENDVVCTMLFLKTERGKYLFL